jgi:predicted DNA-binding mobile mystery protein A
MISRKELKAIHWKRLDKQLNGLNNMIPESPSAGWIRSIREALLMPREYIASKLHIDPSSISKFEQSEQKKTITLQTLEKMANVLGCELKYVLVPKKPLEESIKEQVLKNLAQDRELIELTMALEGQKVKGEVQELLLDSLLMENSKSGKLWSKD